MENEEYRISFSKNPISGSYSYQYVGDKSLFGRKGIYTGGFGALKEVFKEEISRLNSIGSPEVKLVFSKDPSMFGLKEVAEIKNLFSKSYAGTKTIEPMYEKNLESIFA